MLLIQNLVHQVIRLLYYDYFGFRVAQILCRRGLLCVRMRLLNFIHVCNR